MKKQILKIMLCFGIIAISYSCDSSIYIENNETEVIDYGYIPISQYNVDDSGFTTQEGNTILKTDFKGNTKKKLGVFVIEDNQITQSNVPISYTDGLWRGKLMITKENAKVYAYYPYRTDFFDILATELDPAAENAETFFARYVSNKDIATTYADADLQVGAGTLTNDTLSFMLNHQLSVIEITPQEGFVKIGYYLKSDPDYTWGNKEQEIYVSEVKIKDGKNFIQKDGKYYYFFKPDNSIGETEISFKLNEIPEETTIDAGGLNAGNAISQVIGPENTDQTIAHELKTGDFFMKDGSIKAFDATLTDLDKLNCIGIVFQTDVTRIGNGEKAALSAKGEDTPHGLIMALKDAGYDWWQDIPQPNTTDEEHLDNISKITQIYDDIEGYEHNKIIWGKTPEYPYLAFDFAKNYNVQRPEKTTEWFIPSTGQWWDIVKNLGECDAFEQLLASAPSTGNSPTIADATYGENMTVNTINNMNEQLKKIGGNYVKEFVTNANSQYHSCCEGNNNSSKGITVISMMFQPNNKKILFYPSGKYENRSVRCVLAF